MKGCFIRLWRWLFGETAVRYSSSDIIHIDSAGRPVAHRKSVKIERLTLL